MLNLIFAFFQKPLEFLSLSLSLFEEVDALVLECFVPVSQRGTEQYRVGIGVQFFRGLRGSTLRVKYLHFSLNVKKALEKASPNHQYCFGENVLHA